MSLDNDGYGFLGDGVFGRTGDPDEALAHYIPQRDEAGNPDLRKPRIQVPIRCDCPQEWWDTDPRQHRRECPLIAVFLYDGGARNLRG